MRSKMMLCVSAAATAAAFGQFNPTWLAGFGGVGPNSTVRSAAVLANGNLAVGGSLTSVSGIAAPNKFAILDLSSSTWSVASTGTNSSLVYSLAGLPDGDLLLGGNFNAIGGVATHQLARYNPVTQVFSDLGYGTQGGQVNAILPIPGNEVIIGGNIPRVAGMSVLHVARLNLSTGVWSSMNSQFASAFDVVNALALDYQGNVVVAGEFSNAGGTGGQRVAKYNRFSNTWTALGSSGPDGNVRAVAVLPNGDILAGGDFSNAGGIPAKRIALWHADTNTWSAPSTDVQGASQFVAALTTLPDGNFIVAGSFTSIGGVVASRVARYNPSTGAWSAVGAGVNSDVIRAVTLPGGDVVVTGFFTSAGGNSAPRIARLTFGQPAFITAPASQDACTSATLTAGATGVDTSYRWQWYSFGAWRNIFDEVTEGPEGGFTASNSATPTLTLTDIRYYTNEPLQFRCIATNACGSADSNVASLTLGDCTPACDPDVNQDGVADQGDVDYLIDVIAGGPNPTGIDSDFNLDGVSDQGDVDGIINVIAGGQCP